MFNRIQSSFFGKDLAMQVTGTLKVKMGWWAKKTIISLFFLELVIGKRVWLSKFQNKLVNRCIRFEVLNHGQQATTKS